MNDSGPGSDAFEKKPRQDRGRGGEEIRKGQLPCLKKPSMWLTGATMFVLVQPTTGVLPIVGIEAPTVAANTAATTMRTVEVCMFMVPSYSMRIVKKLSGRGVARSVTGITGSTNGVELPGACLLAAPLDLCGGSKVECYQLLLRGRVSRGAKRA